MLAHTKRERKRKRKTTIVLEKIRFHLITMCEILYIKKRKKTRREKERRQKKKEVD